MTTAVARRYFFAARHRVEGLPAPWCETHDHVYTVEVVAETATGGEIVIDTDVLDGVGYALVGRLAETDLNDTTPTSTTVEALSAWMLGLFGEVSELVCAVTVWEDASRWGRTSR